MKPVRGIDATALRNFALGYAAGVGVYLLLMAVSRLVLQDACGGRTAFALLAPLLLGPGGLSVAILGHRRPGWGAFGMGLAVASLFPALFMAGREILALKALGCGGT